MVFNSGFKINRLRSVWASGFVLTGTLLGAGWLGADHALRVPLLLLGSAGIAAGLLLKRRNRKP